MSNEIITLRGEVAAKAAYRANRIGDPAGLDQNRGQFVAMISDTLRAIPERPCGDHASSFLDEYKDGAYGASGRKG